MSLSEVFDHGTVIPWANFRFNNVSIDSSSNSIVPAPSTGGPSGTISILNASGTIRLTTTAAQNVYTFTLPVTAANPNGAFNIRFITLFKGGATGSTNNGLYQESQSYALAAGGTVTANVGFQNINTAIGSFTVANVNQVINIGVNSITFGVRNSVASQTTDVLWYAQVNYFITNI